MFSLLQSLSAPVRKVDVTGLGRSPGTLVVPATCAHPTKPIIVQGQATLESGSEQWPKEQALPDYIVAVL